MIDGTTDGVAARGVLVVIDDIKVIVTEMAIGVEMGIGTGAIENETANETGLESGTDIGTGIGIGTEAATRTTDEDEIGACLLVENDAAPVRLVGGGGAGVASYGAPCRRYPDIFRTKFQFHL